MERELELAALWTAVLRLEERDDDVDPLPLDDETEKRFLWLTAAWLLWVSSIWGGEGDADAALPGCCCHVFDDSVVLLLVVSVFIMLLLSPPPADEDTVTVRFDVMSFVVLVLVLLFGLVVFSILLATSNASRWNVCMCVVWMMIYDDDLCRYTCLCSLALLLLL